MFFSTTDSYLASNRLSCEKTEPICLALVGLMGGWQAGKQKWVDFEIFKILNYLDFYFVNIIAMLLC